METEIAEVEICRCEHLKRDHIAGEGTCRVVVEHTIGGFSHHKLCECAKFECARTEILTLEKNSRALIQ